MADETELYSILRDRQRIIGSPESHWMRGVRTKEVTAELLTKWRAIIVAENEQFLAETVGADG